jgi:hypothetical protein
MNFAAVAYSLFRQQTDCCLTKIHFGGSTPEASDVCVWAARQSPLSYSNEVRSPRQISAGSLRSNAAATSRGEKRAKKYHKKGPLGGLDLQSL